jgi:F-type H+-transporting ATPase subunit b
MLSINFSELIWTIINFFLLYFLLRHFLYKPICEHMDARQARIDAGLEKEREAKASLRAADERLAAEEQAAREEARALLQRTEEESLRESGETLLAARRGIREQEGQKREQMQQQIRQEHERLAAAEPALAATLAQTLLGEEVDAR